MNFCRIRVILANRDFLEWIEKFPYKAGNSIGALIYDGTDVTAVVIGGASLCSMIYSLSHILDSFSVY